VWVIIFCVTLQLLEIPITNPNPVSCHSTRDKIILLHIQTNCPSGVYIFELEADVRLEQAVVTPVR
jgi:hypothetical protein